MNEINNVPLPPEDDFAKKNPVIKTYSSDIAEALKSKQGSVLSIAFAEEKKRQKMQEISSPTSKKNLTFIFLGIIFLGLSTLMIGSFFFSIFDKPQTILPMPKIPSLIAYDEDFGVDISSLSKSSILEVIRKNSEELFEGKVKRILFYETNDSGQAPTTLRNFEQKAELKMPKKLVNSLNDNFFSGVINYFAQNRPIFIFSVNAFDTAFIGMNEWEQDMTESLIYPFDIKSTDDNNLLNRAFQNKTIKNHPARVLVDKTGKIVLLYGFINKDFIVISSSEDAYEEAVSRLLR